MAISRLSSWTRCFWRMMTTSEAVQVAAASNSSSTGDGAAFASPSTRIAGRPVALPSNCSSCSQRIVTAAVLANSVTAPRGKADVQPVPAQRVHAMILEQPVERRAVMQLETEDSVQPEAGTSWIGPAAVAACHRQPAADVRDGDLLVGSESPEHFEVADVGIGTVEQTDLGRGPQSDAIREEIADVQRGSQDQLPRSSEVDAAAHAESEQADARSTVCRILRRHELLCGRSLSDEHTCHERQRSNSYSGHAPLFRQFTARPARCLCDGRRCARSPRSRTPQWLRWPTRGGECRSNPRSPPPA